MYVFHDVLAWTFSYGSSGVPEPQGKRHRILMKATPPALLHIRCSPLKWPQAPQTMLSTPRASSFPLFTVSYAVPTPSVSPAHIPIFLSPYLTLSFHALPTLNQQQRTPVVQRRYGNPNATSGPRLIRESFPTWVRTCNTNCGSASVKSSKLLVPFPRLKWEKLSKMLTIKYRVENRRKTNITKVECGWRFLCLRQILMRFLLYKGRGKQRQRPSVDVRASLLKSKAACTLKLHFTVQYR